MRALLIGAGAWAEALHAPALAAVLGGRRCEVWSPSTSNARRLASRYGLVQSLDLKASIAGADLVTLAVPPQVQVDLVTRYARPGLRLVLEKPLAPDLPQACGLTSLIQQHQIPVLHPLTYRFMPAVAQVLEDIRPTDQTRLRADIKYRSAFHLAPAARGTWRQAPTAVLTDIGPHLVDLAAWSLGPITAVTATRQGKVITCDLEHLGGNTSHLSMNANDPAAVRRQMSLTISTSPLSTDPPTDGTDGASGTEGPARLTELGPDHFVRDGTFMKTYISRLQAFCGPGSPAGGLDAAWGAVLVSVVDAAQRSLISQQQEPILLRQGPGPEL